MSASPGWQPPQPRAHDPARPPVDESGEPIGYDLTDLPMYQQPPAPPEPYRLPTPKPMEPALVVTGLGAGVLGLLATPILSAYTMFLGGIAALICGVALNQARLAHLRLPRLAIIGLVLGVIGLTLGFGLILMAGGESPT